MKNRLISTSVMAVIPALSVFAAGNGDEMETVISYSVSLVSFVFFFFLIKYYFEKNNPEIECKWLIALPLFFLYGWGLAYQAILDPRMTELFVYYSNRNPIAAILLFLGLIVGLVVSVIAFYTIYRILKHKSKPFNSFPAIMRYCTIVFTIIFLGLCYHYNEIDKFSSALGVSFGANIWFVILLVAITWGLQYKFNESAEWIIHDGTSSANDRNARTGASASSSNTKQCPYCGETILAVAKKCRYCGEWIKEEDLPKQQQPCPICGELVDEGTELCPHCNEKISLPIMETSNEMIYEEDEDNYRGLYIILSVIVGVVFLFVILICVLAYNGMSDSIDSTYSTEESVNNPSYEYDNSESDATDNEYYY